jgi:hypothetical protein
VRPVFGATDTERFLWAKAWDDDAWGYELSVPRPGCVVILGREGGGHVTLYERTEGNKYVCRGGNQSDAVNQASYPIGNVLALRWPRAEGPPPAAPRRSLARGDSGPDVELLQAALAIPADGEFGPVTQAGVKGFQVAMGLVADGEVGPATWEKIDALVLRLETGDDGLSAERQHEIAALALHHPLQRQVWTDRGKSPSGYIAGMGQCFALAHKGLLARDPAVLEMAQAVGDPDTDALAWYAPEFTKLGVSNATAGVDVLISLFALAIGLGMRESSGKYYEGTDVAASGGAGRPADEIEAGLFQASWNLKSASANLPRLLEEFFADPNGFLPTFSAGLTPTAAGLTNVGSGQPALYQFLAKRCPAFAVMTTAIGLRTRRTHWGPLRRREVELTNEALDYLEKIAAMGAEAPAPEPEPEPEPPAPEPAVVTVTIASVGDVKVNVEQVV